MQLEYFPRIVSYILCAVITRISEQTTNACENVHSKFNSLFCTHHSDVFSFLKIIKKI